MVMTKSPTLVKVLGDSREYRIVEAQGDLLVLETGVNPGWQLRVNRRIVSAIKEGN